MSQAPQDPPQGPPNGSQNGMQVELVDRPPQAEGLMEAAAAAANEPTRFNPKERAQQVRQRVEEIRHLVALGKSTEQIKVIVGRFADDYPTLFNMAVAPQFQNGQNLNLMLGLLDRMDGGMSQHQASVIVGQRLMDQYVKPVVNDRR